MKRNLYYSLILLLITTDGCRCNSKNDVGPSVTIPEIRIVKASDPVYPGDFTLTIDIVDAVNAVGIAFTLNYDPKVVQIQNVNDPGNSVTKGGFFELGGVPTALGIGFYQNDDLTFSDSSLVVGLSRAGETGINGSGTLMTITFTTVNKGSTTVKFIDTMADLFAPGVVSISDVKWTNAEITVK